MDNTKQPLFKRLIRNLIIFFDRKFKSPYVYRIVINTVIYFDIRLNYPGKEYGQNPLIIEYCYNPKQNKYPNQFILTQDQEKLS